MASGDWKTAPAPIGWRSRPISEVIGFPSGQVDPRFEPYRSMVLVAPDHIESGSGTLSAKVSAADQGAISGKYLFAPGDTLYSKIRPYLRKAVLAEFGGLTSADMYPLRPTTEVEPRFLLAIILGEHFSRFAEIVSMRSGFPKINREEFAEYTIALPPFPEQRRIAEILDTLDEAIRKTEQLIAKLNQVKQGLLHDLFTRGVDDNGELRDPICYPEQFKVSPFKAIPQHWVTTTLGNVADLSSGTTPARSGSRYWTGGTIPWVKTGEVNFTSIDVTEEKVTESALVETGLRFYPPGTVLVAMYGQGATRGRSAILAIAATTNQACAAIQADPSKLVPQFLFAYLKAQYEQLRGLGHGSNQTNLSAALLGNFPLVLPPLSEQLSILAILEAHDTCAAKEEQAVRKLSLLKRGLMEDFLTGWIRVTKLVGTAA